MCYSASSEETECNIFVIIVDVVSLGHSVDCLEVVL